MIKYTTILHDVRNKLGLSMNEYAVYDSIDKISQLPHYTGNINKTYLADFLIIDRKSIYRIIKKGIESGLLKEEGNGTTMLWKTETKMWGNATPSVEKCPTMCGETPHNNNIYILDNSPNVENSADKEKKEKQFSLTLSLDEIIEIWNSVEDSKWIKFKAKPGTNTYKNIVSSYNVKKTVITNDEFYLGLDNYLLEISRRREGNDYNSHRFSLDLFMKQSNGLERFIYNYS